MGKRKRILVLVHPQFRPDRKKRASGTEFDVWRSLRGLGHDVEVAAVESNLRKFDRQLAEFRPDIVFNLLEEFRGEGVYDFHVITFLESLGIAYTGCNPRGLILSRNKLWTSYVAQGLGASAPSSELVSKGRMPKEFPLFIKFNREDASLGITKQNVLKTLPQFKKSVKRLRALSEGELILQKFVPGHEVTVSVFGNRKLVAFAPWRLHLKDAEDVATSRVKFDASFRRKKRIRAQQFRGPIEVALKDISKNLYAVMDLSGYARFDYRVDSLGMPQLIDVNANPNLAKDEDFASSARAQGIDYSSLIEKLLAFGLDYSPRL